MTTALKPLLRRCTNRGAAIPAFLGMKDGRSKPQPTADLWLFEEEQ